MPTLSQIYTPLRVLLVAASSAQSAAVASALSRLQPEGVLTTCPQLKRAGQEYRRHPYDVVLVVGPEAAAQAILEDVFVIARGRGAFLYGGHIEPTGTNIGWCMDAARLDGATAWTPEIEGVLAIKLRGIQAFKQLWLGFTETTNLQHAMLEHIRDGVLLIDADDTVVHANREAERLLGAGHGALTGKPAPELLGGEVDGRPKRVSALPPMPVPGRTDWRLVMFRNGIPLAVAQDDTPALFQDVLTGLPTHLLMQDRLNKAVHLATRYSRNLGVLRIAVDEGVLAQINETYGYTMGDLVLKELAGRLLGTIRTVDTVSRENNGQFVAILQELSRPEDALIVAQRMLKACETPVELEAGNTAVLPIHVGLVSFPEHGKTSVELLARAESALERAKLRHDPENRIAVYSADVSASADRVLVERKVLTALDEHALVMYYQPKVDVATSRLVGVEALLRWNDNGVIRGPDQILPVAEELNLLGRITHWALREAARQASNWRHDGFLMPIAVNVPPSEFSEDLLELVSSVLAEFDLPPSLLELEVTESAMGASNKDAPRIMQELAAIGVALSVDDFGTGYSSLDRLKTVPLAALKVDRSFIQAAQEAVVANGEIVCSPAAQKDIAILRAIVSLASNLQLKTVVEGIEGRAQLEVLRELGVDVWQGFYASRALPPEQLVAWAENWDASLAVEETGKQLAAEATPA